MPIIDIDSHHQTTAWLRRLPDGRCLVLGVLPRCPLPDGVNDANVRTNLFFHDGGDFTKEGRGRSWVSIVQEGWPSLPFLGPPVAPVQSDI